MLTSPASYPMLAATITLVIVCFIRGLRHCIEGTTATVTIIA